MLRSRVPLREYLFRLIGPLIGAAVGVILILAIFPLLSGGQLRVPYWVWIVTASVVFVLTLGASAVGLFIGQRLIGNRIEGMLRQPGGKWRHGRIIVDGPDIVFESYRLQMRIPSGSMERLMNVQLGPDTGRRPPISQLLTINPQLHIITVESSQGQFEFGALPSRVSQLREQLQRR